MRYRVYCSDGNKAHYFYFDSKRDAKLVYDMAIESGFFTYVSFDEAYEEISTIEDWISEDVE
jgi:hypothetical protein